MLNNDVSVIVGTGKGSEHFLAQWWAFYAHHNDMPVVFMDYGGMTPYNVDWCKAHGTYMDISKECRAAVGGKWPHDPRRRGWFCKPVAINLSPTDVFIWSDHDIETTGSWEVIADVAIRGRQHGLVLQDWAIWYPRIRYQNALFSGRKSNIMFRKWYTHHVGGRFANDELTLTQAWPKPSEDLFLPMHPCADVISPRMFRREWAHRPGVGMDAFGTFLPRYGRHWSSRGMKDAWLARPPPQ